MKPTRRIALVALTAVLLLPTIGRSQVEKALLFVDGMT